MGYCSAVATQSRPTGDRSAWSLAAAGVGWVDLHPVTFDEAGHGRQADVDGGHFDYPPDAFSVGSLASVPVPCLSRAQQLRFRRGYEPREVDLHDLKLLEQDPSSPQAPARQLFVVAGLPGAGQTTLARRLARQHAAVRFNADKWMADLGVDRFDARIRNRLEQRMIRLAAELLAVGGRVVIDFGSWSRAERDQLLSLGRDAGARVELHILDPDIEELWRRLSKRNNESGETRIDRPTLESYLALWGTTRQV